MSAPKSIPARITEEEFQALSQPERAVAVAKDVLECLEDGKYTVETMTYCEVSSLTPERSISEGSKECHVCGIGAMFISGLSIKGFRFYDYTEPGRRRSILRESIEHALADVFEKSQLDAIEFAFEGWTRKTFWLSDQSLRLGPESLDYGADWVSAVPGHRDRLRAICLNIIRNKGEFRIEQVPCPPKQKEETQNV